MVQARLSDCMRQSFSLDALKERWGYESPVSREEEERQTAKPAAQAGETGGAESQGKKK